ncbi:alpha/beta fold hydrolase [Mycobacterium sp. BMJ-28]
MSMNHGSTHMRRAVAVLCTMLWALATMWMAGGVAHADDTSTKSPSEGSSSSGTQAPSDKPDTPATSTGTEPKPAEDKPGTEKADKPDKTDTPKPARGTRKHATATAKTAKQATDTKVDTKTESKTDPKREANVDTKTDAKSDPTAKTVSISTATANVTAAPAALRLAATPTPTVTQPATASAPNPIKQATQFVRQMAGLANDLALIAVSLVNNLAAAAATAIGPKPFFGVPYRVATAVAGTAAVAAKLLDGTPLDAVSEGPFKVNYGVGDLLAWLNPAKSPAGANDPSITTTPEHPLPIILLNGTSATQGVNWSVGAPVLANAGYKVYTFNYGNTTNNPNFPIQATADIRKSAQELADFVEQVRAENPEAGKVILIGHSQGGGIMPSYYINNLGGDRYVSQFIGIAPSNHGTDVDGLTYAKNIPVLGPLIFRIVDLFGAAWTQQALGSSLQQETYGQGDTRTGVLYTTISSKFDWVVTPYTQQALTGPNVTNIVLQDLYPNYNAGHLGIVFSAPTWTAVLGALAANEAANPAPATLLAA